MISSAPGGSAAPAASQWSATFVWLGRCLLGLMLIVIIGSLGLLATVKRLNQSAAAFVEEAIPAMAADWDGRAFLERAHPGILPPDAQQIVPKVFAQYAVLGPLDRVAQPTGRIGYGAYPGTPFLGFWAEYRARADFRAGPAQFRFVLAREADGWRIAGLDIASPVFGAVQRP